MGGRPLPSNVASLLDILVTAKSSVASTYKRRAPVTMGGRANNGKGAIMNFRLCFRGGQQNLGKPACEENSRLPKEANGGVVVPKASEAGGLDLYNSAIVRLVSWWSSADPTDQQPFRAVPSDFPERLGHFQRCRIALQNSSVAGNLGHQ